MNMVTFVLGTSLLAMVGLLLSVEFKDSNLRVIECPRCHLLMDKEKLHISGYDSENSSKHVHCPRCKAYIAI